jgi:hypothetical protein
LDRRDLKIAGCRLDDTLVAVFDLIKPSGFDYRNSIGRILCQSHGDCKPRCTSSNNNIIVIGILVRSPKEISGTRIKGAASCDAQGTDVK